MKGIFKNNFQGRNAFISNDYYLRTYGRLNAGRRSRTFAAWRAACVPSLHFERCVFSLRRTLCSMVEQGVVGPLQGESCVLLMQEDNPHGELGCRHVHALVHSLLGAGGSSGGHWDPFLWTRSILWWGERVNGPFSQKDCDDRPAEQVSVRETDRTPFVLEGVGKTFLRKWQTDDKVINST